MRRERELVFLTALSYVLSHFVFTIVLWISFSARFCLWTEFSILSQSFCIFIFFMGARSLETIFPRLLTLLLPGLGYGLGLAIEIYLCKNGKVKGCRSGFSSFSGGSWYVDFHRQIWQELNSVLHYLVPRFRAVGSWEVGSYVRRLSHLWVTAAVL